MYSRKISSLLTAVTLGVFQISIGANAQGYPQESSYQPQQPAQPYSGDSTSSGAFSQQYPQQGMQNSYSQPYGQQQSYPPGQQQAGYQTQQSGAYGTTPSQQYPPQYGQPVQTPQSGYPAQSQYPVQPSGYPAQPQYSAQQTQSQYPGQQQQQQQYQQPPGQEPTYYGYATDAQGGANYQNQGQYGSYSNQGQAQAQQQPANLQDYLNQDQGGQQSSSEHAQKSEGSGKGAALLSAGKALAGVAGTVATGYFLSKAAQKQAQNGGVPIMPNGYGYGGQYGGGYGMPYGGGYGYGTPYGYGNGYGMPMGTSVMTGLNSLLGR